MPYLNAVGTANPPYCVPQTTAAEYIADVLGFEANDRRRLQVLYKASGIQQRFTVLNPDRNAPDSIFAQEAVPSTALRLKLFEQHALPLSLAAIKQLPHFEPTQITHLILVSCTGMYAPGPDIALIHALGLRASVERFSIQFMGCYAAFNALKLANYICSAQADAQVLIVGIELCTLHLQPAADNDSLLANAIFADGAAAALVSNQASPKSLLLERFYCDLEPKGEQDMAWRIGNHGFEMKLSSYVPSILEAGLAELVQRLLSVMPESAKPDWFAIHPGGRKILEAAQKALSLPKEKLANSYKVLEERGNMSSVTVLYVLERIMTQLRPEHHGERVLSMSFGPGLTMESALLRVCAE